MVMGRPNKGVDHVDRCDGSRQSKLRTKVILQTITGELSVNDACERLGIQRAHFRALRARALQGSVDAIEPGRPGRPRKQDAEQDETQRQHEAEVKRLEQRIQVAEAQVLLAQMQRGKRGGSLRKRRRLREDSA